MKTIKQDLQFHLESLRAAPYTEISYHIEQLSSMGRKIVKSEVAAFNDWESGYQSTLPYTVDPVEEAAQYEPIRTRLIELYELAITRA